MTGADPTHTGRVDADALVERLRRISAAKRLLVAIDFDGTLAPFVLDPADARIPPAAMDAILGLAARADTRVAVVSGRALASLERVAQVPGTILLVGSHGVEYRLDHPEDLDSAAAEDAERVRHLHDAIAGSVQDLPGVRIETKPAGITLHTRGLPAERASEALRRARAAVADWDGALTEREGKDVLEYAVRDATKGDAIRRLRAYTQATAVFYAGDDVTDEDAFAALQPGDLGVKCGEGPTLAEFRVADLAEMTDVLRLLAAFPPA